MRTAALALAALAAVLVLAGCGSPPHYSLTPTRDCLRKAGASIGQPTRDFVAQAATGGSFRAWLHGPRGNFVTISFGDTAQDARDTAEGYVRFHAKNVGVFDILALRRNAVLLWRMHPSRRDLALVTNCLK